jgi:hypothetical protein
VQKSADVRGTPAVVAASFAEQPLTVAESRLRSTALLLRLRRPRDGTKLERSTDISPDFRDAAAEIERLGGQIVVSPVQNIAAGLQRLREADRRAGTLSLALGNEKRLSEIVLQF